MFSAACLILSISILFLILKFRVHIHVEYTPTSSGRRAEATRTRRGRLNTALANCDDPSRFKTGPRGRNVAGTPSSTTRSFEPLGRFAGTPRLSVRKGAADVCGGDLELNLSNPVRGNEGYTLHTAVAPQTGIAAGPRMGNRLVAGNPSTGPEREAPAQADAPLLKDLVSALMGLGSSRTVAKEAAQRAMFHQDPDLETALRRAIDYASRSNAA